MEESLKATRLIHQLVILLSATLIAFALSAEAPPSDYSQALQEFRLVQPTLDAIGELHSAQVTEYYTKQGVLDALRSELSELDVTGLRIVGVQGRFGRPWFGAGDKAPISSYHRYLLLMEKWERLPVWKVDINSLRHSLQAFKRTHSDLVAVSNVYLSAERPKDWDKQPESYDASKLSIAVAVRDRANKSETYMVTEQGNEALHRGIEYLTPQTAIKLAYDRGLLVKRDGQLEALPALRDVWDTVGALDMGSIEQALARKDRDARRSAEGNLELFGLKIKSGVAVTVGPIALLAAMLYLFSHIKHLVNIAKADNELLRTFPWEALFDGVLSKLIGATTFVALPAAGVVWLVVFSSIPLWLQVSLALTYGLLTILLGLLCLVSMRQLVSSTNLPTLSELIVQDESKPNANASGA